MNQSKFSFANQKLTELNVNGYTSLIDAFEQSCDQFADQVAFSCVGHDLSFKELEVYSRYFAAYLTQQLSLKIGDRVAIQLPNCNQYPIVAWAVMRAGLVLVNTNPMYTEREIIHQFKDAGVCALIVFDQLLPQIEKIKNELPIEHLVSVSLLPDSGASNKIETKYLSCVSFNDAIQQGAQKEFKSTTLSMSDIAILQYTGGTTGPSKGAILSHGNLFASSQQTQDAVVPDEDITEISIAPMPLYHIYGFAWNLVSCCLTGIRSVLIPDPRNIDALIQTMKAYPFTGFSGVNTLFAGLMQHPQFDQVDFSHLVGTISGGSALVSSIAEEWERRTGTLIFEGYALSETASSLSCNIPDARQIGTVGKPMPAMEVKVVDKDGGDLDAGNEGELLVRGPQVTQGYWNKEKESAQAVNDDGWFHTGDVATIDEDGFIRIVDRIKDMILVSGFNVYPNEIEDVVSGHPDIFECAVIGVPDERTGEAVKLFAVKTSESLLESQVVEFCEKQLTRYKLPKQVEFVKALPKSNVGKILRRELRNQE